MTELRVLSALQTGQNPGAVSSILKLRGSEIRQAVTRLGVDVIGHDGLAVEPVRPLYRLNHEPPVPGRDAGGGAGISQRPCLHDLRRLIGNPARDHREDDAGALGWRGPAVRARVPRRESACTVLVGLSTRMRTRTLSCRSCPAAATPPASARDANCVELGERALRPRSRRPTNRSA